MKPLAGIPRFLLPTAILLLVLFSNATLFGGEPQPTAEQKSKSAQVTRVGAPPRPRSPRSAGKYRPGELLVRFRRGVAKTRTEAVHARVQAAVVKHFRAVDNLQLVRLPAGARLEEAIRAYRQNPDVLYAEPNYIRTIDQSQVMPNDPRFAELWALHNTGQTGGTPGTDINAPEAWALSTGSPNVVVAVIDSGVDYNHEDLSANMFRNPLDCDSNGADDDGNGYADDCYGIDTFNGDSDPMDDAGHGTHVAGTIGAAGNNGVGVVGVNWQVKIVACKFISADGFGSDSGAIACLDYLADLKDRGVNLVATNNSWGGGDFTQALLDAIDSHRQRGILFIAASGNESANNDTDPHYPSSFHLPNIISVAATDRFDSLPSFSNRGRRSVHVGAPGVDILSTVPASLFGSPYFSASGTSMAAPHVTGVAALLVAQDPTRDWRAIKNLILAGGDSKTSLTNTISRKRLNAFGSMTCSNSVVRAPLLPRETSLYHTAGVPLILAALHINCASPNGSVQLSMDGGASTISLNDDGVAPDQEAGDGIYSAQHIWSLAEAGTHTLTFPSSEVVTVNVIPPLSPYTYSTAVPFNYRTITGTALVLGDEGLAQITSPFPIPFGGVNFSSLNVVSNGYVTFLTPLIDWFNQILPIPKTPSMVAPFWDDLWLFGSQTVYWEVTGTAPNRELVIEWRDVEHFNCGPGLSVRFQIVFFEGSSNILFNYADVTFGPYDPNDPSFSSCYEPADAGASATVGVQVEPGLATQFSFNTPSLTANASILWQLGQLAPTVTRLSPFTALAGGPAFKLRVFGTGFFDGSVVRWNGSDRPTTFVNSTELSASISDTDIASAGPASVTVFNPLPNGAGESAPATLTVFSSYPAPVLTSVSPDSIVAGPNQTLTLTGSDFVSASVARWNGADQPTIVTSSTQLEFLVRAADIGTGGNVPVTVFTPSPGGGTSDPVLVSVTNPAPTLVFAIPRHIGAGGAAFTMEVFGSEFVPASVVRWNGSDRPTVLVDTYLLTASIPATDIASPGNAQLTVFNSAPGGGTSDPITIEIATPPANDNFANATLIASAPFTETLDTRGASTEPTDPAGPLTCNWFTFKSVWYRFTPPAAGTVLNVDTAGSTYDNALSAWTGSPGSFTNLGCMVGFFGQAAHLRLTASSTAPIYFMVNSESPFDEAGTLVFNLGVGEVPWATLSTSDLFFPPQIVNTSATLAVMLTNSGGAPLSISGMTLSGPNAGQFTKSDNCAASLIAGGSCAISVTSHPTQLGPLEASLTIAHNASGSPSTVAISGMASDFSVSPASGSTTSATVNAGQSATYSLSFAATSGFIGSASLSCLGAPNAAVCIVSPSILILNGTTPVAATVTVTTTARAALPPLGGPRNAPLRFVPLLLPCLLAFAALLFFALGFRTRRFAVRTGAFALTMVLVVLLLNSCGGGSSGPPPPPPPPPGTPAGTYTLTVSALSGGASRSISLTLIVR